MTCSAIEKDAYKWKRCVGVDLGYAISKGGLEIGISQQFARQWSIDANQKILLSMIKQTPNEEISDHYNTLYPVQEESNKTHDEFMTGELMVSYWPVEAYKGMYLQTGCRIGIKELPQCIIGLGYAIKIWKGLTCIMSYDTTITQPSYGNFGLKLSYTY